MKDELGWIIIAKLVGLRAKSYSYLIDDGNEDKKIKMHKKVCHKKNLNLKIIKLFRSNSIWVNHPEKNKIDMDSL